MTEMLTLDAFEEASAKVQEVTQKTGLIESPHFSAQTGNKVFFKPENMQRTGAYKVRGAYYKISTLTDEERERGLITASAGNHAQGVAFAASRYGAKATIVMPTTTPLIKVERTQHYGGTAVLHGDVYDEACEYAMQLAEENGYTFIHPFNDPAVATGQGTIAMEIVKELPLVDYILVPIGGGGLATGVSTLAKLLNPHIKVIGVEPANAACMKASLEAGHVVKLPSANTIADGTAVLEPGDKIFPYIQQNLDDIITVDSDAICAAMKDLFEDVRAVAEPSGALALAGMKKYIAQHNIRGERLAHILSGANVNFHGLRYVSERCELGEQREALLAVTIPEEKGSFLKFCQLLGGRSVTEFNYRFADAKNACIFVGVRLSRGLEERKEILQMLNDGGYSVVDLSDDEMAKLHVRYMVGGRPSHPLQERLYSFEFPESPGALLRFLNTLGTHWNISLFHYRSHGTDYGRVLAAFELGDHEPDFETRLNELGYDCHDETNNPAFRFFLAG